MIYLLDTNACIRYLNGRAPQLLRRLEQADPNQIAVCSVVKAELFYGANRSNKPEATLAAQLRFLAPYRSLPFNDAAAIVAGEIRAHLASKGTPIGPYDLLIAAIAVANDCTLITHNVREFGRVPNLHLEDWEAS